MAREVEAAFLNVVFGDPEVATGVVHPFDITFTIDG